MQIELRPNPASVAFCGCGFADVFKCTHQGMEVAVKVLRTGLNSDLRKVAYVSYY